MTEDDANNTFQLGQDHVANQFHGLADYLDEELIIPRAQPGKPDHLDPATLEWCTSQIRFIADLWTGDR